LRRIGRSLLPALVAASVTQLGLLIDTVLASFLATGSVSWLYYSDRLMEFPLGLLGVALGIAILPRLTRAHAGGTPAAFSATLDWALRWVLVLGLPAAVGLGLLAGPIIAVLFHSEAFGSADVLMAARSLMAYAPGLVALMGIKVLMPGFFSRHDSGTPLRMALLALATNLVLSVALMGPLAHAGLALATTVAALLNAGLLLHTLTRQGSLRAHRGWSRLVAQVGLGSVGMALMLWLAAGPTLTWIGLPGAVAALRLGLLIVGGAGVYGALVLLLGLRPRHLSLSGA
jgi:putative peptidoglycan lipid II flippase